MRVINIYNIPHMLTRFTRHGLFPTVETTLRVLFTELLQMRRKQSEFDVTRFLTHAHYYASRDSMFTDILKAYEATDGDLKSSEYDPILQECADIIARLELEIWDFGAFLDDPGGYGWFIETSGLDRHFVIIYDNCVNVKLEELLDAGFKWVDALDTVKGDSE
jgi:hypothetical protein